MKWLRLWRVIVVCSCLLLWGSKSFAQELEYHRFRFFIHPDVVEELSNAELKRRLSLYVEDLNTVFAKQTLRRFKFNPETDITIYSDPSLPGDNNGNVPPVKNYEVWAQVLPHQRPDYPYSYGGYMGFGQNGAGVAKDLHWLNVHDRSSLENLPPNPETSDYWRQIHTLIHEIEHVFGVGSGEYYGVKQQPDRTNILPLQSIDYFTDYNLDGTSKTDPYWSRHADYWRDPMTLWTPELTYRELLQQVRFANVSVATINSFTRLGEIELLNAMLPDLAHTRIKVLSGSQRIPVPYSRVMIWKVQKFLSSDQLLFDGFTDNSGSIEFAWNGLFSNYDYAMLIKVFPPNGDEPAVRWYSIFDAQEQKMVFGRNNLEIPVYLSYTPQHPTFTQVSTLSATEDTPVTITYSSLLAASNLQEPNGLAPSFLYAGLGEGQISKNGVVAVPGKSWLGPGEQWVWTPRKNVNGQEKLAFSVTAHNGIEPTEHIVPVFADIASVNDTPVANAGVDQKVTATGPTASIALNGNSSYDEDGDPISYQWSVGSTPVLFSSVGSVDLPPGLHTIVLTVSDGAAFSQDTVQISIQPQTTTLVKFSGDGALPGGIAKKVPAFSFSFSNGKKGIAGTLKFDDKPNARSIKSTRITAVSVNGKVGRAFGTATVNGTGSYDFFLEVNDLGKKGSKLDTFKLQLSNGLVYSGTVFTGDIQVQ